MASVCGNLAESFQKQSGIWADPCPPQRGNSLFCKGNHAKTTLKLIFPSMYQ